MSKHTPGPWFVRGCNPPRIYANSGMDIIAQCDSSQEMTLSDEAENAAFIVRSANCHDDLVAALQRLEQAASFVNVSAAEDCERADLVVALEGARAALAKAQS